MAAVALEPPATPSLPTLRQLCVRAVASAVWAGGTRNAALFLAPSELRQEVLLLLTRWGLLTPPAAELELHWAESLPNLETLSLAHCALLTSEALQRAFESAGPLPRLASLSLHGVLQLTDAACAAVLHCCPALATLDVSKCPLVAEQAIAAAGSLRALTSINLAQCWRLEDLSPLTALSLASLNMSGCHRVSGRSLRRVSGPESHAPAELEQHKYTLSAPRCR